MDKQTLSNYGWLVIVTLILAVMLALATPFGTYVGDAVVSVANGYVGASNNAVDDDNISKLEQQWTDKLGSVSSESYTAGIVFRGLLIDTTDWIWGGSPDDRTTYTWDELKLMNYMNVTDTTVYNAGAHNALEIRLPNTITHISDGAFSSCSELEYLLIPKSVISIGINAFFGDYNLTNITYLGTKAEWEAIEKSPYWNSFKGETTITCTDGTIFVPANNDLY